MNHGSGLTGADVAVDGAIRGPAHLEVDIAGFRIPWNRPYSSRPRSLRHHSINHAARGGSEKFYLQGQVNLGQVDLRSCDPALKAAAMRVLIPVRKQANTALRTMRGK